MKLVRFVIALIIVVFASGLVRPYLNGSNIALAAAPPQQGSPVTEYGLEWPGNGAVRRMLYWHNPFPIYDATYIFKVYPRKKTTGNFRYYTTFFWGNDGSFIWDQGNTANTYYGAHPYPVPAPNGPGQWEISVSSNDYVTGQQVQWNRWYTQAFRAWRESPSTTHHEFYWDWPDTSKVIDVTVNDPDWASRNPPIPSIQIGQAAWEFYEGDEEFNGIIRGIQIYSGLLSLADIASEIASPKSTAAGQNFIWYLNVNPRPSDVTDKKDIGTPHNPSWRGTTAMEWIAPPIITNITSSNITSSGARVTWLTDRPTDSQVEYGTTSSYGQTTVLDATMVSSHSVNLSGLSPNTTYHFRVRSKDPSGSLTMSPDQIFTTISPLTVSPGTIQNATVGVEYSDMVVASGGVGPYTFSILSGSLPPGLTLNASTGAITGKPTAPGTSNFTVRALDSTGNTGNRVYSVAVSNIISGNVSLVLTSQIFLSTPSPGLVGRLALNFSLINNGPAIDSPIYFQLTQLSKVGVDENPAQPDALLTADNGFGFVGAIQSAGTVSLGSGQSTPISFLVGLGSRQQFTINVELYTGVPGSALTSSSVVSAASAATVSSFSDSSDGSFSNVGVIAGPGSQSRPSVAIDPNIPVRMAVASNDYASNSVRVNTTEDGGQTWRSTTLGRSVLNQNFYAAQDPAIAFDSLGRLSVVYVLSNLDNSANAVVVSESSDGINFNPPVPITFHPASERIIDSRPAIAIRSGLGRYVAWDSFSAATGRYNINLARSSEGGLFGPAVAVVSDAMVSSPALALGKSTIYLGWDEWGFNSSPPYNTGGRLMIASSPQAGPQAAVQAATLDFGVPREIARTAIGFGQSIPAMPELGAGPNLAIAVDPNGDERVYATFVDKGKGMDVRLASSLDSGTTWQTATVNDDTGSADQFSPALAVDSHGNVNVIFYDTRLSSTFQSADVFLARPTGATSFGNQRITTMSSNDSRANPLRNRTANLGDRTAIAMTAAGSVIAWTDTRLGSEDIFLSMIPAVPSVPAPQIPAITWNNPVPITYGAPLTAKQLSASASTHGTFVYSPPPGALLNAGNGQTLAVTFTPSDAARFSPVTATVRIDVMPAPLIVSAASVSRFYGSPNPPLSGSIAGLVNRDNITATFTTPATASSPPGNYPVVPVISDPNRRLPNYKLTLANGTLTVVPAPIILLSATSLSFGSQSLFASSKALTFTVGNVGTADLLISDIALGGQDARDFASLNNCGNRVAAGRTCTVTVTFKPSALRNRAAIITLTDNTGGYPGTQQRISLSGQGALTYAAYATSAECAAIALSGNALVRGDIALNGNVALKGDAIVEGTIYALRPAVGPCRKGSPGITIFNDDARARGGYSRLPAPIAFSAPAAVVPGTSDVKVKDDMMLPPGKYRDITVEPHATLTLSPGTYTINSLKLKSHAAIKVPATDQVIVNIAGRNTDTPLDLNGGSIRNASASPASLLWIYAGSDDIKLTAETEAFGILYAPNAGVRLGGQAEWYGALVVKTLEVSGRSAIRYDRSLQ